MKGINVKKIAAFAGAAVLFGSAFAVADVVYGSTQLVDQNGQPTVKIYVGSNAQISDGVAAANIAAKIANEAYKSSTLTASVSGTPTCSVGTGVGGAGTCSLVESSKKVTLEVSVPGTIAGTHTFKTLITDTIDRTLANRNNTADEDNYPATLAAADTSGSTPSPLRGYSESSTNGALSKALYMIGAGQFTGFADYSAVDNQASTTSYTEVQSFWIGSKADAVKYDSNSDIRDVAVNTYSTAVYSAKFMGNDYGIPVCTGDLLSNRSDDWTSCLSDPNSRTDRHRLKIKFMGAEWLISDMDAQSLSNPSSTAVVVGGQIKLAKEAKYGIINVGQVLDAGVFKVRLSDISVATGSDNTHPAIIDILDANEAVIGQVQISPDTTYTFTQSGTGNSVKIHVYKTAPGFTLNAKWAEMAIYNDEITLKSGSRYNLVSGSDVNQNFYVSLLWKNKDFTSGSTGNEYNNYTDSLREIVIYDVDTFSGVKYKAGDVYNFLKSPATYKLTYNGVDLTDGDYVPVSVSALSKANYRVAILPGGDASCAATSALDYSYDAKMIRIKTGTGTLFGGAGKLGNYNVDEVLFDPIGTTDNSTFLPNGTQNISSNVYSAKVFFKPSGKNCWNWANMAVASALDVTALTEAIKFETVGDNSGAYGAITYVTDSTYVPTGFNGMLVFQEDAGKLGASSNSKVHLALPYNYTVTSTTDDPFRFKTQDTSTSYVYYHGVRNVAADIKTNSKELPFVTERGSKTVDVSTNDASIKFAKKIGMPTFQFSMSDVSASSSGEEYIMGVGESKVFGGVTVKVKAIDATTGSCSVLGAGGAPACTVDSTGLSAVISPNNAATVEATEPYKLTSSLVHKDTDGASSGVAILIGGPAVNTMTADALRDTAINFDTDSVVVREIGNKIVVAGKSAADTMTAATQFIAGVKRQ